MARPQLSLTGRALRLLGQREHSRAELARKLAPHAGDAQALEQVLDTLQAKGFINEQRVLESLVHRRAAGLGVLRLRQELQAKGLAPEAVASALGVLRGSELERARALWQKKFGAVAQDRAERARQLRFLAARGFTTETLRKVVAGTDED